MRPIHFAKILQEVTSATIVDDSGKSSLHYLSCVRSGGPRAIEQQFEALISAWARSTINAADYQGHSQDVRDRAIIPECSVPLAIISDLKGGNFDKVRQTLRGLFIIKSRARIYTEAETFKALELQVKQGLLEPAIESLEEFMEVIKDRLKTSPFDEEDPWLKDDDRDIQEEHQDVPDANEYEISEDEQAGHN
jgi:hypothetical protein